MVSGILTLHVGKNEYHFRVVNREEIKARVADIGRLIKENRIDAASGMLASLAALDPDAAAPLQRKLNEKRMGASLEAMRSLSGFDGEKWTNLHDGIAAQLATLRLRLTEPKSRLLATREGVPFCGFRFLPGMRPRILGATKRRFESRRRQCTLARDFQRLTGHVSAWYQYAREANSEGLLWAYGRNRAVYLARITASTSAACSLVEAVVKNKPACSRWQRSHRDRPIVRPDPQRQFSGPHRSARANRWRWPAILILIPRPIIAENRTEGQTPVLTWVGATGRRGR